MSLRLRSLPIPLAPIRDEAIGSYLHRLADANRLRMPTLSILLIDDVWAWRRDTEHCPHWTPEATNRLAALTTRSVIALTYALPAMQEGDPPNPAVASDTFPQLRAACRCCAARHGCLGMAIRRYHSHQIICRRHRRALVGAYQFDLCRLPEIVEANQSHRRLARRHGHATVDQAYQQARRQLADLLQHDGTSATHQSRTRLKALGHDTYGDPLRPGFDRLEVASYPEAIGLSAALLQ